MTGEYKKFAKLADDAIALSKERRLLTRQTQHYDQVEHLLNDWCTVNINVGRRSGKTYYAALRTFRPDLMIVPNQQIKRHVSDEYLVMRESIMTIHEVWSYHYDRKGQQYKLPRTIFIDEPQLCFAAGKTQLSHLHTVFSDVAQSKDTGYNPLNQTYVLLGSATSVY